MSMKLSVRPGGSIASSTRPASSRDASAACPRHVSVTICRSVSIHIVSHRSSTSSSGLPARSTNARGFSPGSVVTRCGMSGCRLSSSIRSSGRSSTTC
ncbi:MAG: hypothetical protein R3F14_26480 [Polyangiaceae bacterium]